MSIVVPKYSINRWDKDSIRPGPVGSVGDVNVQVMLRKSSIDMPERFDPTFSGKNAPWSGSNVSDGSWYGWTSGGREATVISKAMPNIQTGGKTNVGWVMQNIVAADRSRETKMTPLGRYGWDTTVGSVLRSKTTGDLFLPLPGGYEKSALPRGSQFPRVIAESIGDGIALPAADVEITDPVFGDTGVIKGCTESDLKAIWAPAMDDPRRKDTENDTWFQNQYPYRKAKPYVPGEKGKGYFPDEYPEIAPNVWLFDNSKGKDGFPIGYVWRAVNPCGKISRDPILPQPQVGDRPMPGNQDKRRQDRKKDQEDEKKKKQKLR